MASLADHITDYNTYLKNRYQSGKVYKISVDGGFTCPNRDGSKGHGGCTYCNVDSFTPAAARNLPTIKEQILNQVPRIKAQQGVNHFIIYFQPNTNTYAPVTELRKLFEKGINTLPSETVGLNIGTRTDCLNDDVLELLGELSDRTHVTLEIGMESPHNETLKKINRGYEHEDFTRTMNRVISWNEKFNQGRLDLCLHSLFGFPWESREQQLEHARIFNSYPLQSVKLHQLHITRGSVMGSTWERNPFDLYTLESYTDFLCELLPRINKSIAIQRLFATSAKEHLIAPQWQEDRNKVRNYMEKTFKDRGIYQGSQAD